MNEYAIPTITFHAGPSPSAESLSVVPGPLTVIVGPNAAGKSQTLRDIESLFAHATNYQPVVLRALACRRFDTLAELIATLPGHLNADGLNDNDLQDLTREIGPHFQFEPLVYQRLAKRWLLRLDGSTRLNLLGPVQSGDLRAPPQSVLMALFQNDAARLELRTVIHEAIGRYIVIDPTSMGSLRVGLSARPPVDKSEEQNWDERAVTARA